MSLIILNKKSFLTLKIDENFNIDEFNFLIT